MNNAYQTSIKVDHGFEVNELRPIITYTETIENAKCAECHAHPRAQIISCDRGIMEVVTKENIWIVNPSQSVWIPSYEEHQVYFPTHVKIISAFIDPSKLHNLPKSSFAFDASSFIKSLLIKIVGFSNPDQLSVQQNRVFEVLLDELTNLNPSATFVPTSQDKRLKKITDAIMNDLSSKHTIEYYASSSSMSSKTLSRLFVQKLGMSFGDWKMRLKLMEAIKQLGEKKSVKEISIDLGYENVSSFIATFKKHFGKTPTNYVVK